MLMANVFFQATKDALDNITEAFDFVHPLRVSMRYTRKCIEDFKAENPNIADDALRDKIDPTGCIHGVAYTATYIDTPWDRQEEKLVWLLLNNLFSIHEGWVQRLYDDLFCHLGYKEHKFVKDFETPGLSKKFSSYYACGANASPMMHTTYYNKYKNTSALNFSKLENYLLMYRYYKEARNCYMHRNIVADSRIIDAYNNYLPIATLADLETEEVPAIIPPILGNTVQLSMRGVIGFSQFVRRIIIISDISLIGTLAAEIEFINRIPPTWTRHVLSGEASRAKGQITRYSNKVGLLKPVWNKEFQDFLIKKGIFSK